LAAIRKMLTIHPLDPNWTLPSRPEDNPLVWRFEINGLMMEVRHRRSASKNSRQHE
jgi:hypothetical protein